MLIPELLLLTFIKLLIFLPECISAILIFILMMIKQILLATSVSLIFLLSLVHYNGEKITEALKVRSCTTDEVPRGVDARNISGTIEVWIATYSSSVYKFAGDSCTNTKYTSGITGDPHFINVVSNVVVFTEHIANKIGIIKSDSGTIFECNNTSINGPDDISFLNQYSRYFTNYNNAKLGKVTVSFDPIQCRFTFYNMPLSNANPTGIDRSSDANGYFVIDQRNRILYKFQISTGQFTLCASFNSIPNYVDADDTNDRVWITFFDGRIRIYNTITCELLHETPSLGDRLKDIALMGGNYAVVTWS